MTSGLAQVALVVGVLLAGVTVVVLVVVGLVRSGAVSVRVTPAAPADPLPTWAARLGWSPLGGDPTVGRGWRGWPFVPQRRWAAADVWVGTWAGRRALTFRYVSTEEAAPRHVTAVELPVALPFVEVTPHVAARVVIRADLAVRDLDLESSAFNDRWRVATSDARFAHALLHPRVMELLLEPGAAHLGLAVDGRHLVCWSSAEPDGATVTGHLGVLTALADAVPDFVWQERGHRPGAPTG